MFNFTLGKKADSIHIYQHFKVFVCVCVCQCSRVKMYIIFYVYKNLMSDFLSCAPFFFGNMGWFDSQCGRLNFRYLAFPLNLNDFSCTCV